MAHVVATPFVAGSRTEVGAPIVPQALPKRARARAIIEPEAPHGETGWRGFVLHHTIATIWMFFALDAVLLGIGLTVLLSYLR